jgi:Icc-related predicted phosphoesterase
MYYLLDEELELEGLKFYGSPYQPEFCNWAFNLPRGPQLARKWAKIPDDTDVLITHGPPGGILDRVAGGELVGCNDLRKRVKEINPKLHVFGHIHEAYGWHWEDKTIFVNAANCDLGYNPINKPVVVEIGEHYHGIVEW